MTNRTEEEYLEDFQQAIDDHQRHQDEDREDLIDVERAAKDLLLAFGLLLIACFTGAAGFSYIILKEFCKHAK